MLAFYQILANSLIATVTIYLVWFSLSIWVYLQTRSVVATAIMAGIHLAMWTISGLWFGSLIDHHKKKPVMIISSLVSLISFSVGLFIYILTPDNMLRSLNSPALWILIFTLFIGVISGNIRAIAMPVLVGILVPEKMRDKANGLVGAITGVSFLVAPILGGFLLAFSGLYWILILAVVLKLVVLIHLFFTSLKEKEIHPTMEKKEKFDFLKTLKVIQTIPGLSGLIIFNCFNNFLGGVYMPLMDPYGLSLVPQQIWGIISGVLSLGFIVGGLYIAKKGLGKDPLKTLFFANIIIWAVTVFFTLQPWIILYALGTLTYMILVPFVEASEQTIIQKVVPKERQGRVFGFAQSVEWSASPLTAFAIGPITQYFFIPFMTTGAGVGLIGNWFGVGEGRGIALVFTITGVLGLIITLIAMNTRSYHLLSAKYKE